MSTNRTNDPGLVFHSRQPAKLSGFASTPARTRPVCKLHEHRTLQMNRVDLQARCLSLSAGRSLTNEHFLYEQRVQSWRNGIRVPLNSFRLQRCKFWRNFCTLSQRWSQNFCTLSQRWSQNFCAPSQRWLQNFCGTCQRW